MVLDTTGLSNLCHAQVKCGTQAFIDIPCTHSDGIKLFLRNMAGSLPFVVTHVHNHRLTYALHCSKRQQLVTCQATQGSQRPSDTTSEQFEISPIS